jgi:hypothetical protein
VVVTGRRDNRLPQLGPLVTTLLEATLGLAMAKTDAVLLHVGLDGSGHVARDRFLAYGIVTGLEPQWRLFHHDWGKLLDRHDLTHIRMTDAVSFQGPFKDKAAKWGSQRSEQRNGLLLEAAEVITRHLKPGGASCDFAALPSEKVYRYKRKVLFQYIIGKLLDADPDYVLAFLCDDEQDSAPDFYKLINAFKLSHQRWAQRLGGICFFDDRQMSQIQAADIVAWALRERRKREVEHPSSPPTQLESALLAGIPTTVDAVELRFQRNRGTSTGNSA